jgi:predicted enzyme related to lactoylglutathione lyase
MEHRMGPRLDDHRSARPRRVVHLELHTPDQDAATVFYTRLLGWRAELIETRYGSYQVLGLGHELDAGVVECPVRRPLWLPYVEVDGIDEQTEPTGRP